MIVLQNTSQAAILLLLVMGVVGCRATASLSGSAAPAAALFHPTAMTMVGTRSSVTIASAADCTKLTDPFLVRWCGLFVQGVDAQQIEASNLGQTPEFYAYLATLLVRPDRTTLCDQDLVLNFARAGMGGPGGDPATLCRNWLRQVEAQRYFEKSNPLDGTTVRVLLP